MSDSDFLSIQLFVGSLAACVLAVAMTQAGWTHRWFIRGMFALAATLAISAVFWRQIAPFVPPLDELLGTIAASKIVWCLVGFAFAFVTYPKMVALHGSPLQLSLEIDATTNRYGLQTFPGVTYVQVAVKCTQALNRCRLWIERVEYSPDPDIPFSLRTNERHQCRWSRPQGLVAAYEIDLIPEEPSIRANIGLYTAQGIFYDPQENTPSNLVNELQHVGVHRFQIKFNGSNGNKIISETQYLYLDWRGPSGGAFIRMGKS